MSEITVDKEKFGEIVRDDDLVKRPLYDVDIELLMAMRTEQNLKQSMRKHKCFDDPVVLERIRILREKITNLELLHKELDSIYGVE